MKNTTSLIIISIIFIYGCHYGVVTKPKNAQSVSEDSLFMKNILGKSKNGYWLAVRGYHFTDHLVATATVTDYSHAAVLDLNSKSVIEANAKGVHETKLIDFVHSCFSITLVKPYGYTNERGDLAVKQAREKIGKSYDFLGTVGINDTSKYYCSELAAYCYLNLKDSLKYKHVVEPAELLKLGDVVYVTPERKIK